MIKAIRVVYSEGEGTEENPMRIAVAYYTEEGEKIGSTEDRLPGKQENEKREAIVEILRSLKDVVDQPKLMHNQKPEYIYRLRKMYSEAIKEVIRRMERE